MLLRRISKHVKDQNWFAVFIDFCIVVVGVFIGIQVANWNAAKADRETEQKYLLRLHNELTELIETDQDRVLESESRVEHLEDVARFMMGEIEAAALTQQHCGAVISSHIYVGRISTPSSVAELTSTGNVLLISNDNLRSLIVEFAQSLEQLEQLNNDIQSDRLTLSRKYPDLITLDPLGGDASECDFSAMRNRAEFRNDLSDNSYRYGAYSRSVVVGQQTQRTDLHAVLDEALDITHEDESPQ